MFRKSLSLLALFCAFAMMLSAQARNVFVMPPGDGALRPVTPFTADPFQLTAGGIQAAQDAFLALSTPSGSKYYFIGRSGTDTVVIANSGFGVTNRLNLGTGATAAAVTPDGRFLLVATSQLVIINTATDAVVTSVDVGGAPNDIAVSRDNTRAFVTSQTANRVTAVDLGSFFVVTSASNLGPVTGVTVGPNGLVYVSATNVLYEMDPQTLALRGGSAISLNAQPGKPVIVADTFGNSRAVMINTNPGFGGSSLISVDLGTRTVTPILANNIVLDRLVPVAFNRMLATASNTQLYEINLPNSITPAAFSGLTSTLGVRSVAVSDEFPSARFAYLSLNNNSVLRVDLASNTAGQALPLANPAGPVSYTGAATASVIATAVYQFNNGQFINPSSQGLPLVIRAVDATGRPASGVPVQFSTQAFGAIITGASSQTDGLGYAQANIIAPGTLGAFQVIANVGSVQVQQVTFNLTVGTGTQGPTGALSIRAGNGQVIRESQTTPEPLRVIVRDTAGNPVPNVVVNWSSVTNNGPNGTLAATQTITDFLGETTNTFTAPFIGPNLLQSFVQSTVTASTFNGSVSFFVTSIPIVFGQNPASPPVVQIVQPNVESLTARAGTTLPSAVQVRVSAGSGPGAGTPIPNVAVTVGTGLDPTIAPTATCSATSGLTDANGFASCDLVIGNRIGSAALNISVGGQITQTIQLTITPGLPGKMIIIQGDNQTGGPGETLPLALLARVEDGFGNPLPNTDVRWTVESGQATLLNSIVRSDSLARVSTLVRLGSTPGPVRIRVTAQGGSADALANFNATVNIGATQLRRISGDGQSVTVSQPFPEPLVAQVLDANGAPVPGVQVNFTVNSGTATLSAATATSDSGGNVRVNVTAGATPGTVTIGAAFGGNVVSWSLTIRPLGPTIASIANAASGSNTLAPGSVATIRGTNIAPSVRGYLLPGNPLAPLPGQLSGVSVTFGGVTAPIFWISNIDGQEAVTVQVPFEAPDSGSVPVTVTSAGTQATVNVTMAAFSPGIYENVDSQGRRYAIITRADGSYVTPDNPIGRGEMARAYLTGLGRTNSPAFTNALGGVGQRVTGSVVVGINDAGVPVMSAEYAQNLIGVYVVTFQVPNDTTPGLTRNFGVGVNAAGGNTIFANGSTIAIR
ncbi:MAG: Ig-like domain-containing protein [Bryobacterales bacterium]|nr:Ig-like domain-containing protein [Bryobacterales bacterium]